MLVASEIVEKSKCLLKPYKATSQMIIFQQNEECFTIVHTSLTVLLESEENGNFFLSEVVS